MPFRWIADNEPLPSPREADDTGIVAVGGRLDTGRLVEAYTQGIFPWFNPGEPVIWWSPDPRMVLFPHKIHISKTLRQWMRRHSAWRVTRNRAFDRVIEHCATVPRRGQESTWITPDMLRAYKDLHRRGLAVSYEVWDEAGRLVGGLYGVDVRNGVFSGESMFSLRSNASKLALIELCRTAPQHGYRLIDAQVHTPYLELMGGELIPRDEFLTYLG